MQSTRILYIAVDGEFCFLTSSMNIRRSCRVILSMHEMRFLIGGKQITDAKTRPKIKHMDALEIILHSVCTDL